MKGEETDVLPKAASKWLSLECSLCMKDWTMYRHLYCNEHTQSCTYSCTYSVLFKTSITKKKVYEKERKKVNDKK